MTVLIAETTSTLISVPPLEVTEDERIVCDQCDKNSPYFYDGDGEHDAQDLGWHITDRDECDCSILCRDCSDEWCGYRDTSPRLVGMRTS